MFYFRINKIKIINNRELIGKAEVKLMSFITTDDNSFPEMDDFIRSNDNAQKKQIIESAIKKTVSAKILTEVDKIKDNHVLLFGDTGYVLYQSSKIPTDFNWQFIAYESDAKTRDNAAMALAIINDKEFDGFVTNLALLVGATINPVFFATVEVAKFVAKTILKIATNDKDDQIGIVLMSLNRQEHYLHGIRNKENVSDITGNVLFDYSIFAYEQ